MKAIAASHKIEAKVALIASDALPDKSESTKAFTEKWVKTQQGHWTKVWCTPLAQFFPDWGECPAIQKVEDVGGVFNSINLKTFRVVFPRCYLTGENWNLACKTPVKLLSSILPVGVTFRAYGWHHNPATKEEAVIGFCKLPDSVSENPMTKSGWESWFLSASKPSWPARTFEYFVDSQHKQKSCRVFTGCPKTSAGKQVGLALRRGGNSNLGLLGCKSTNEAEQMQRRRWVAKMVPHTWTPAQFQTVLEKSRLAGFG